MLVYSYIFLVLQSNMFSNTITTGVIDNEKFNNPKKPT